MRILLYVSAITLACWASASPTNAADIPLRPYAAPPPFEPYNWSGWHIGVNVGYGFGGGGVSLSSPDAAALLAFQLGAVPTHLGLSSKGFMGGAQIGVDQQFGSWVVGLEADIAVADVKDSRTFNGSLPVVVPPLTIISSASSRLDYFGTVRGRFGYAWDRVLVYATGGLAYGGLRQEASLALPALGFVFPASRETTQLGYAVGGGAELALSRAWTVRAEYLYYDLGHTDVNVLVTTAPVTVVNRFDNSGHIVRAALNYRF